MPDKMFETDDDDFMPSSSANLSSIFNASVLSDGRENLSYKAPKQPKPLANPSSDQTGHFTQFQSSVILAKVITLWKLDNGQNTLLGKHIVAIIGNTGQQLYELIIYQEKTNILIRQSLNENLIFYKYPKNFLGIFDSQKQFWNLSFDTPENQERFLQEAVAHQCQIIEQKSQNLSDQVDNTSISKTESECVNSNKTDHSINDQMHSNDNVSKDKILSRITKMGRQILPRPQMERKTSTELSDSENESNYSDTIPQKPTTMPRKFRRNTNHDKTVLTPVITTPIAERNIVHSSYSPNANQIFSNNNQMMLNPHSMVYSQPYPDYGVNNFIIAQNAELKANLAEISLKLNTVLSSQSIKVDKNGNSDECDGLKSKIKCLNLKIENLTSDLEKWRQMFEDLKKTYELQCVKLFKEQEINEKWKSLPEEISSLKEELRNLETLKIENEGLRMCIKEKDKLIESQRLDLNNAEKLSKENILFKENFSKEIDELNSKIEELTLVNKKYEAKLGQQENISPVIEKVGLEKNKEILRKQVKETMNEAFRSIMEQFDENEQYNFKNVQKAVLDNLKKTTYTLINALD